MPRAPKPKEKPLTVNPATETAFTGAPEELAKSHEGFEEAKSAEIDRVADALEENINEAVLGEEPKPEVTTYQPFAHVTSTSGQVIRTYTLETHGDNFRELAQEFADKRGLTVK